MSNYNQYYRKEDLLPLMQKHRSQPVVVFDLETNGLDPGSSVLSCSALKFIFDSSASAAGKTQPLRKIDTFDRYYFSIEPENISAIRINGLSTNVITDRRAGHDWPIYFKDDSDFETFCLDAGFFVAHNIQFDTQFVPGLAERDQFCTMKSNTIRKYPKLSELAAEYGIGFNINELHQSMYDTEITAEIFQRMVGEILPDLVQGELF